MPDILVALFSIYIFILIGFLLKAYFKDELHDKSVTLISVYALQPFLTFWGLYDRDIDYSLFLSPMYYLLIVSIILLFSYFIAKNFSTDKKNASIVTVAAIIGNTGNLGIPIGIALFGSDSIPYTTIINLANIFIVFTLGVYFYSRGEFSIKRSLLNIVKLPVLWIAFSALIFNSFHIKLSPHLINMLEMGAYASIAVQLIIFGIYINSVKVKSFDLKLNSSVLGIKFILVPIVAILVLSYIDFNPFIKGIILMELIMPLAIMNVNLSSLYNCKVSEVTGLVLYSSVLFIPILIVFNQTIEYLGWK